MIGLSGKDRAAFETIEGQRKLLDLLLKLLMPSRREELIQLAEPCLLLKPQEGHNEEVSHFVGTPRYGTETTLSSIETDKNLLHLGTFNVVDFRSIKMIPRLKNF